MEVRLRVDATTGRPAGAVCRMAGEAVDKPGLAVRVKGPAQHPRLAALKVRAPRLALPRACKLPSVGGTPRVVAPGAG